MSLLLTVRTLNGVYEDYQPIYLDIVKKKIRFTNENFKMSHKRVIIIKFLLLIRRACFCCN